MRCWNPIFGGAFRPRDAGDRWPGLAEDDGRYGAEKPDGEQDRAGPLVCVPPTAVALPVLGGMFGVPGEGALVDRHVDRQLSACPATLESLFHSDFIPRDFVVCPANMSERDIVRLILVLSDPGYRHHADGVGKERPGEVRGGLQTHGSLADRHPALAENLIQQLPGDAVQNGRFGADNGAAVEESDIGYGALADPSVRGDQDGVVVSGPVRLHAVPDLGKSARMLDMRERARVGNRQQRLGPIVGLNRGRIAVMTCGWPGRVS